MRRDNLASLLLVSTSDGATVLVHREARAAILAAAAQGVGNGGRWWLGLTHRLRRPRRRHSARGEERTATGNFARTEVGGDEQIWGRTREVTAS